MLKDETIVHGLREEDISITSTFEIE